MKILGIMLIIFSFVLLFYRFFVIHLFKKYYNIKLYCNENIITIISKILGNENLLKISYFNLNKNFSNLTKIRYNLVNKTVILPIQIENENNISLLFTSLHEIGHYLLDQTGSILATIYKKLIPLKLISNLISMPFIFIVFLLSSVIKTGFIMTLLLQINFIIVGIYILFLFLIILPLERKASNYFKPSLLNMLTKEEMKITNNLFNTGFLSHFLMTLFISFLYSTLYIALFIY